MKVVIGMSGGVDSSVAAAVLKEQGHEVIGVTMRLWDKENEDDAKDAAKVAEYLGIRHETVDFRQEFSDLVVDYFTKEYLSGRTPNPCVACNRYLKFEAMRKYALSIGAEKMATGHYARICYDETRDRYLLRKGMADAKDQTYVLYSLTQEQLRMTLMPLGEFEDKDAVREKAVALGIPTAQKKDSMEICFIPDQDYAGFIKKRTGSLPSVGDFVDTEGNVLGQHRGIVHYTVGQRKGLGIAFGKPMFVLKIDPIKNQVVLGESGTEFSDSLLATDLNLIPFDSIKEPISVLAKVRYSAKAAPATVFPGEELFRVEFTQPQRAVTPGQAVVFYSEDGDFVLGGGTIVG